jgi:hypothetical protein
VNEAEQLERIFRKLDPAEQRFLAQQLLLGGSRSRIRRRDQRDEAIREARHLLGGNITAAGRKLERLLDRHIARADSNRAAMDDPISALVERIAQLNENRSLGWRQLVNIFSGHRTPPSYCNSFG